MEVTKEMKDAMIRYLLGMATSAEQEELENRYAADAQVFEQLVAVENDLLDQYSRHELSAQDRSAFERHVLAHPRRRARAQFAKAFIAKLNEQAQPEELPLSFRERWVNWWHAGHRSWALSLGMAAATLCLIAGAWWLWRVWQMPAPIEVVQQTRVEVSPTPVQQPSATPLLTISPSPHTASPSPTTQPSAPAVLAFTLVGAVVRDGGKIQTLNIPTGTKQVQLKLNLAGEEYPQYQIQLRTSAGREIAAPTKLKPAANKKLLAVSIPSKQLPQGDFFLALSGVSDDNQAEELITYFFRVTRK